MSFLRRKAKPPAHIPQFGDLYTYAYRGAEKERVILFVALDTQHTIPPHTGWHGIDLKEPEAVGPGHSWIGFDEYPWRYLGNAMGDS